MTRPDLILSCSASGRPRSANTLPELASTSMPLRARFAIPYLLCECLGYFEPGVNDLHVSFGSRYPAFALLLEAVEDKHRFLELDGVDGPIGSVGIVFDYLQHAGPSKALQCLGGTMLFAVLSEVQGVAEELPHTDGKSHQVLLAAPDPEKRSL